MGDKIKQIPQQVLEFWQKFSSKQKTLIIALTLALLITVVIFVILFTRTTYEQIAVYEKTSDTASAKTVLEEEGIKYQVDDDGLTLSVDSSRVADARMALGQNSIGAGSASTYSYDWALDNDLSTTSSEFLEKKKLADQVGLGESIVKTIEGVEAATVQITYADDSTSILEEESDNTCAAMLTTNDNFKKSSAKGVAQFLATSIGNTDTNNIKIIDQNGAILFSGAENEDGMASMASADEYKDKLTNDIRTQVQALLLKSSTFNDVEVAPNMAVDFNRSTITDEDYYPHDERETGPISYEYEYENENNYDSGKVVGTDANDGEATDYDISNGGDSSGNTNIHKTEYNNSKRTTVTQSGLANVNYEDSSISVVLNRYRTYYEDDLKDQLKENDQTFAEFKEQNGASAVIDVDPALYTTVAMATGIAEENISINAYEIPLFYDAAKVSAGTMIRNYIQYLLALIILALLLFVVFKGMKPIEVEEVEPELSVEQLLATTKENTTLDDIEFSDKSAARERIEEFVDQNPEAVAQLLRNWLNEDWE